MYNSFISSKPGMFQESYHSTSSRYKHSLQLCGDKKPCHTVLARAGSQHGQQFSATSPGAQRLQSSWGYRVLSLF